MPFTWFDAQWHKTLNEASSFQIPYQLRRMFVSILTHCDPENLFELWSDHKTSLAEDYLQCQPLDVAIQLALWEISSLLVHTGKCLSDYGIP